MTQEERNPFKIRKQVELHKEDYEWFVKTHGDAKLSWIVNLLFHTYRTEYENVKTPVDIATAATNILKEELENGLHQD